MRPIRIITVVALGAGVSGLAACQRQEAAKAPEAPRAAVARVAGPSLWNIEAINDGKVVRTVQICADEMIRSSFSRPTPEFKGQPCDRAPNASDTSGSYAARCRMDHQNYVISATTRGDPASDFTVDMSVARQDKSGPTFEQTRHYVRVGACPAGWAIGDTAALGDRQVTNALAPGAGTRTAQ